MMIREELREQRTELESMDKDPDMSSIASNLHDLMRDMDAFLVRDFFFGSSHHVNSFDSYIQIHT